MLTDRTLKSPLTQPFPKFSSQEEMKRYYVDKLGIEKHTVDNISEVMSEVVQIFSIPLVDSAGDPIALLSIDCKKYVLADGIEFPDEAQEWISQAPSMDLNFDLLIAHWLVLSEAVQRLKIVRA